MAQSLNTKVDYTCKASSLNGFSSTGNIMVGDKAFEYYNVKNVEDYIQIPWEEIDYIAASVLFGKWIQRFAIFTKSNGHYTFSAKDNKKLLNQVGNHFDKSKMLKSLNFFQVITRGFKNLFHIKSK